jgi:hypothetical protein
MKLLLLCNLGGGLMRGLLVALHHLALIGLLVITLAEYSYLTHVSLTTSTTSTKL